MFKLSLYLLTLVNDGIDHLKVVNKAVLYKLIASLNQFAKKHAHKNRYGLSFNETI